MLMSAHLGTARSLSRGGPNLEGSIQPHSLAQPNMGRLQVPATDCDCYEGVLFQRDLRAQALCGKVTRPRQGAVLHHLIPKVTGTICVDTRPP